MVWSHKNSCPGFDTENEVDDTETASEFMDGGVGHDVFRRGTVAEKRFIKNKEKVDKELGTFQIKKLKYNYAP